MGEVYHARDLRLKRPVALKILPHGLSTDPDRGRRFTQEAQLASSLQHPGIVTIFDIGSDEGTDYLAMELVRGRTLDRVIPKGGLRVQKALRYAIDIADALAAAHGAGIVHRDLKPGNIMVTDEDRIKILDFGLATLTEPGPTSPSDDTKSQMDVVATRAGTIIGTVAYMSPEQAQGKPVDARSDLFSFGAVLYEMLSGRRAFHGDNAAATIAAVITVEPAPLSSLADAVPHTLDRLVSRCLRKDISRRAQHASDVKLALEELLEDSTSGVTEAASAAPASHRRSRIISPTVALTLGLIAAAIAAAAIWYPRAPAPLATVSGVEPAPLTSLPGSETSPTLSHDGSQVAFVWERQGDWRLDIYMQLAEPGTSPLRLTDDGANHRNPSWSPDGKWIAFWHSIPESKSRRLALVSPLGGPERQVLEIGGPHTGFGGGISWSPDGKWLAVSQSGIRVNTDKGILLVSPITGEQVDWAALDPEYAGSLDQAFSSDGRRLAFVRGTAEHVGSLFVVDVDPEGRPTGKPARITTGEVELKNPVWTPDGKELLLVGGAPTSNGGVLRVSLDGSRPPERIAGLGHAHSIGLSADGTQLIIARGGTDFDIWRMDLTNPESSQSILRSTLWEAGAEYSPDGTRIAFDSNRTGGREIWVADADGRNAMPLTSFGGPVSGTARWSPDGREIAFDSRPDGNVDIFVVAAAGGPVRRLTKEPGEDARPAWSADGRWIYFASDRGGPTEIWRIPADGGTAIQVTKTGGASVFAAQDGEWIYYNSSGLVRRVRPDGRDEAEVTRESVPLLSYTTTPRGFWFVARPTETRTDWSLMVLRPGESTPRVIGHLGFPYYHLLNVSISPDERYALVTKPDPQGADLLLVKNFR
jgi:Tol biopolymer transport system component